MQNKRIYLNTLIIILIAVLLWGCVSVALMLSRLQYNKQVADMIPVEATVVDTDLNVRSGLPDVMEVSITYEVDGVEYSGEMTVSVNKRGSNPHYSAGDKANIFYDPENPAKIAYPNSADTEDVYRLAGYACVVLAVCVLEAVIKRKRKSK